MKLYREVPVSEWQKQWIDKMPDLLFYAVKTFGGEIFTTDCSNEGKFEDRLNVTHVLEPYTPNEVVSEEAMLSFIDWFGTWQTDKQLEHYGINDILDAYKKDNPFTPPNNEVSDTPSLREIEQDSFRSFIRTYHLSTLFERFMMGDIDENDLGERKTFTESQVRIAMDKANDYATNHNLWWKDKNANKSMTYDEYKNVVINSLDLPNPPVTNNNQ